MNRNFKKLLVISGLVSGLLLLTVIVAFVIFQTGAAGISILVKSLITGCVVAGLYIPFLSWLFTRSTALKQYAGIPLEETVLNEENLTEAVSYWVYIRYRKHLEGRIQFLEDNVGNVICRATVRKD